MGIESKKKKNMALIPFSNSSSTLNYVVWSSEHNHGGGKPVKDRVFVAALLTSAERLGM